MLNIKITLWAAKKNAVIVLINLIFLNKNVSSKLI